MQMVSLSSNTAIFSRILSTFAITCVFSAREKNNFISCTIQTTLFSLCDFSILTSENYFFIKMSKFQHKNYVPFAIYLFESSLFLVSLVCKISCCSVWDSFRSFKVMLVYLVCLATIGIILVKIKKKVCRVFRNAATGGSWNQKRRFWWIGELRDQNQRLGAPQGVK